MYVSWNDFFFHWRFSESLLYYEINGNILNVVANDKGVKEGIEDGLLEAGFKNLHLVINVQDHLSVSELSKTGEPLHGAKFVYVNEGVDAFHANKCYATTGSLMFTSNKNRMYAVTCRHALKHVDTCYTLIDNKVVKLGKEMPQPNNKMEKLHDDIAVILIDEVTRSIIYEKCEKLLIDDFGYPSPAKVSLQDLKVGDIVHKRGATTGLTTGTVKKVETTIHDNVIYIAGWNSKSFAEKGDSGSLVFRHSLSPEKDSLNVVAMVQAKTTIPYVGERIICFPMKKGCGTLIQNIPELQDLQFYDRWHLNCIVVLNSIVIKYFIKNILNSLRYMLASLMSISCLLATTDIYYTIPFLVEEMTQRFI